MKIYEIIYPKSSMELVYLPVLPLEYQVFGVTCHKRPCAYVNFCDHVTVPRNELLRYIFHTCTARVGLGWGGVGTLTFLEHAHMFWHSCWMLRNRWGGVGMFTFLEHAHMFWHSCWMLRNRWGFWRSLSLHTSCMLRNFAFCGLFYFHYWLKNKKPTVSASVHSQLWMTMSWNARPLGERVTKFLHIFRPKYSAKCLPREYTLMRSLPFTKKQLTCTFLNMFFGDYTCKIVAFTY